MGIHACKSRPLPKLKVSKEEKRKAKSKLFAPWVMSKPPSLDGSGVSVDNRPSQCGEPTRMSFDKHSPRAKSKIDMGSNNSRRGGIKRRRSTRQENRSTSVIEGGGSVGLVGHLASV